MVAIETKDSAGDAAPDRSIRDEGGATECDLAVEGLGGGRILLFLVGTTVAGRGSPAMQLWARFVDVSTSRCAEYSMRVADC